MSRLPFAVVRTRDLDDIDDRISALAGACKDMLAAIVKLSDDVSGLAETTRAVLLARSVPLEDRVAAAKSKSPKLADPKER